LGLISFVIPSERILHLIETGLVYESGSVAREI